MGLGFKNPNIRRRHAEEEDGSCEGTKREKKGSNEACAKNSLTVDSNEHGIATT